MPLCTLRKFSTAPARLLNCDEERWIIDIDTLGSEEDEGERNNDLRRDNSDDTVDLPNIFKDTVPLDAINYQDIINPINSITKELNNKELYVHEMEVDGEKNGDGNISNNINHTSSKVVYPNMNMDSTIENIPDRIFVKPRQYSNRNHVRFIQENTIESNLERNSNEYDKELGIDADQEPSNSNGVLIGQENQLPTAVDEETSLKEYRINTSKEALKKSCLNWLQENEVLNETKATDCGSFKNVSLGQTISDTHHKSSASSATLFSEEESSGNVDYSINLDKLYENQNPLAKPTLKKNVKDTFLSKTTVRKRSTKLKKIIGKNTKTRAAFNLRRKKEFVELIFSGRSQTKCVIVQEKQNVQQCLCNYCMNKNENQVTEKYIASKRSLESVTSKIKSNKRVKLSPQVFKVKMFDSIKPKSSKISNISSKNTKKNGIHQLNLQDSIFINTLLNLMHTLNKLKQSFIKHSQINKVAFNRIERMYKEAINFVLKRTKKVNKYKISSMRAPKLRKKQFTDQDMLRVLENFDVYGCVSNESKDFYCRLEKDKNRILVHCTENVTPPSNALILPPDPKLIPCLREVIFDNVEKEAAFVFFNLRNHTESLEGRIVIKVSKRNSQARHFLLSCCGLDGNLQLHTSLLYSSNEDGSHIVRFQQRCAVEQWFNSDWEVGGWNSYDLDCVGNLIESMKEQKTMCVPITFGELVEGKRLVRQMISKAKKNETQFIAYVSNCGIIV